MSLVVDASVVIKWFVDEPLHERARLLLEGREALHAPDLLIAEVGNIVWKKVGRGEIDAQQAKKIVRALRDAPLNLYSSDEFTDRAVQIALSIKHPVYDCLYIACTEALGATLVTADERLCKALANTLLSSHVQNLRDQYQLRISTETIKSLIALVKRNVSTFLFVYEKLSEGKPSISASRKDLEPYFSLQFRRLLERTKALPIPEQVDLLALGWLSEGNPDENWQETYERARKSVVETPDKNDPTYLLSLTINLERGWKLYRKAVKDKSKSSA